MAINGVGYGTYGTSAVLNQSVQNLKNQMTALQSQLTSGEKSTTYAGMGVNEGFAIAARAQLSNISAFTDTMTNINTDIGVANTGLQAMVDIGNTVQNSANSSSQTLEQLRTNHRAANRDLAAVLDAGDPQYAGGQPLSVFGQRHQHAVGRLDGHHSQRNHHPGRIEAGDLGAPAGRSRRQRSRAPRHYFADARHRCKWRRMPPARRSA